jgi:hypothetical protein
MALLEICLRGWPLAGWEVEVGMLLTMPSLSLNTVASMVCGKTPVLQLKNNYGAVKYDKVKHQAVYPPSVPAEKLKKIVRNRGRSSKGSSPKKG